jgi:phage terminase large subunit-like protein
VKDWADLMISDAAVFPKRKHAVLVDSVTQALILLRSYGLAQTDEEVRAKENG